MKTIKKSIVLLFSASLLFLGGCAKNHNDIILHKTKTFWSGSPAIELDVPYPESLTFELPSAEWTPLKIQKKEGVNTRVELAEGVADSYVKVAIDGQTKSLFESLETESGVDFGQSDSLILMGLFDHYKTMTKAENSDKPIQYSETKFERQDDDAFGWMVTSNGSYSVAYAVLMTKNNNYFTVEVNQKNRETDIEKILLDIVRSHKTY
ncbi:hypothetical protein B7982_07275 [Fibrobacter sp. UWB2]|uniref:hypothetical protein n=1 Tax=Fibrobacter sp. UWB2 TaxID=1964358 RepID=UPI000B52513F|nr:hypothetical protein [Fibrobacter sp. UWB2]OWV23269.1 hypothetical protein B7982_07275 [Fibrobacter sp. UWB2]